MHARDEYGGEFHDTLVFNNMFDADLPTETMLHVADASERDLRRIRMHAVMVTGEGMYSHFHSGFGQSFMVTPSSKTRHFLQNSNDKSHKTLVV